MTSKKTSKFITFSFKIAKKYILKYYSFFLALVLTGFYYNYYYIQQKYKILASLPYQQKNEIFNLNLNQNFYLLYFKYNFILFFFMSIILIKISKNFIFLYINTDKIKEEQGFPIFIEKYIKYIKNPKKYKYPIEEIKNKIKMPLFPLKKFVEGNEINLIIGEKHKKNGQPIKNPEYVVMKQAGLYNSTIAFGKVGSGKTSAYVYPILTQCSFFQKTNFNLKMGALILDAKGNMIYKVENMMINADRENDLLEMKVKLTDYDFSKIQKLNLILEMRQKFKALKKSEIKIKINKKIAKYKKRMSEINSELFKIQNSSSTLKKETKIFFDNYIGEKLKNKNTKNIEILKKCREELKKQEIFTKDLLELRTIIENEFKIEKNKIKNLIEAFSCFLPSTKDTNPFDKTINFFDSKNEKENIIKEQKIIERIKRIETLTKWNPLWGTGKSPQDLAKSTAKAIENVKGGGSKTDPFWDNAAINLLAGMIEALTICCEDGYFTFSDITFFFGSVEEATAIKNILMFHFLSAKIEILKILKITIKNEKLENTNVYKNLEKTIEQLEKEYNKNELSISSIVSYRYFHKKEEIKNLYRKKKIEDLEDIFFSITDCIKKFDGDVINVAEETLSSVRMNFQITLNRFNAAGIRTSLCPENKKDVTFKGIIPSIINEGKWIVLNVPLREYDDGAILVSTFVKIAYQEGMLSRTAMAEKDPTINIDRSALLLIDEFQNFVSGNDGIFCAESREAKCINFFFTQSYDGIIDKLGSKTKAGQLIGAINNKFFLSLSPGTETSLLAQKTCGKILRRTKKIEYTETGTATDDVFTGSPIYQRDKNKPNGIVRRISYNKKEEFLFDESVFSTLMLNQTILCITDGIKVFEPFVSYALPIYNPIWGNPIENPQNIVSFFDLKSPTGPSAFFLNNLHYLDKSLVFEEITEETT